ncbi:MAG TPA: hypothetical protein VK974_07170 [Methylophilaceae bacterium]|nr:hypothetical protein [Methylophilaceae bacterium]
MKIYAIVAFYVFSAPIYAADFTLNLDSIKLNELAKIVYGEILHAPYIADDSFNRDETTVTLRIINQDQKTIANALTRLATNNGYQVTKQGGLTYIEKSKVEPVIDDDRTAFYYQPRYRNVQYLADMLSSIFTKGRFTFQRQGAMTQTPTSEAKTNDVGTSAASYQSKNYDSFIFYGTDKETAQLQKLLKQVDIPSGEILVKAYIYEVTANKGQQTAFSAAVDLLNFKLGISTGQNVLSNALSFKGAGIEAVYSALSSDSRFKIVSAPSLRVKDRENAKFTVGQEVPILGSVSYQGIGQAVQSVQYKSSGIILDIYPIIRADNIELQINQQLSNFIPTTTGVNNSPTLIKRELSSVVNSQDEDIIVMGGLEETTANESKTGFKWLPDWLKNNGNSNTKSDILLVLQVTRL